MNSENSPIPESDNTNFESIESLERLPSDELSTEEKLDAISDIWSAEDTLESTERGSEQAAAERSEFDSQPPEPLEELEPKSDFSPTATTTAAEEGNFSPESKDAATEESDSEPELFVDSWLDEADAATMTDDASSSLNPEAEIDELKQQKTDLQQEIADLKAEREQLRSQQMKVVQENLVEMLEEGTKELKERKAALRIEIDKLERRKERINQEMRSNFAGSSKELAIRVQGFKEYLVGSLQGLAAAAEKLELSKAEAPAARTRERVRNPEDSRREGSRERDRNRNRDRERKRGNERGRDRGESGRRATAQFSEPTFADQSRRIRQLLDRYRNNPDYYGSPWQLRRTFEAGQAQKVQEWFFGQGGRGTVDSTGSRLQNILVASAAISILHSLYGDRCRVLVLTDTPENLGEWRRGLQDCLGISRSNFGANRGVTLFDSPEVLVQRAERLLADKLLPMIVVDETEELLNLSVLKFPLWMAFASSNRAATSNYLY